MLDIVCQVFNKDDRIQFTWSLRGGFFPTYTITKERGRLTDLRNQARKTRDALGEVVRALNEGASTEVRERSAELAEAGYGLYECILPQPRRTVGEESIASACAVRQWLEDLHSKGLFGLEIVVDDRAETAKTSCSIPWNLVYDEPAGHHRQALLSAQGEERWRPFWGMRYLLTSGRRVEPLTWQPYWTDPWVVVVVDPTAYQALHNDQKQQLNDFLSATKLEKVQSLSELKTRLGKKVGCPLLLYWLGHARPDILMLGNHDQVTPSAFRELLESYVDPSETQGMLVFLNACRTGVAADEESFVMEALQKFGLTGMIVTEHQTIDNYANEFGLAFLRGFLQERKSLGKLLYDLRREKAPLGLIYGAYCPPEITIGPEPSRSALDEVCDISQAPGKVMGIELEAQLVPIAKPVPTLPEQPYRSLDYYDYTDRLLFTGRDADVVRFAATLDRPDTRILVLHGESGIGKSSFLRAGVIPYLEEECVGYRFLRDAEGQVVIIQASKYPVGRLAVGLLEMTSRSLEYPAPTGGVWTIDLRPVLDEALGTQADAATLRTALMDDPGRLATLLERLSAHLPHALVLVLDQAEDLFTLAKTPEEIAARDQVLRSLQQVADVRADVKVIVSLRTEYYGRLLDHLRAGRRDLNGVRDDLLRDFSKPALIAAIERPTQDTPLVKGQPPPRQRYGFTYAPGVAAEIADGVLRLRSANQDSVLPLVQVICTRLYDRKVSDPASDREVSLDDLRAISGVEGGLKAFAEDALERLMGLGPEDRDAFKAMYTQLCTRQADGTLTTWLARRANLEATWNGSKSFDKVLDAACEVRLLREDVLRIEGEKPQAYVRLGHDALAKVADPWRQELERRAERRKWQIRGTLAAAAALIFAGLLVLALRGQDRAVKAEKVARANEAKANDSAAESRAVLGFLADHILAAARPEGQEGGLGREVTLRKAVDTAERQIAAELKGRPTVEAFVRKNLGLTYYYLGELPLAISQDERALDLFRATLGPDHPDTLATQQAIAEAYRADGKLALAIPLFERTLAARQAKLGPDHPDTLATQQELAVAYQVDRKLDRAIRLLEQTLEAQKARLGPHHSLSLASQNNLAYTYQLAGRLALAIPLFERTLAARQAKLGPDHPDTLASQNDLALAYVDNGERERGIALLEQTLAVRQAKLGPDHPLTLNTQSGLAVAYQRAGKLDRAIPLFLQTLAARQDKFGPDHPATLASRQDLANAYQQAYQQIDDKRDRGLALLKWTLEARQAKLGSDHPDTLVSQQDLAYAYQVGGKLALAIPLFEQTLEARKAKLGPDHPDTFASQNNLAYAYQVDGRLDQAIPLFERTLEARQAKLGPDNPDTLASQNNLAYAYQVDGRLDQAIPLFERTLEARKAKLGPDHPDTFASQNNLAYAYQVDGWLDQAIPLFERTLEARKAKLGPDHPDTLASQNNLALAYVDNGERERGIALLEQTLEARKAKLGPDHPDTFASQHDLAYAYQVDGRLALAIPLFERILEARKAKLGPDHPDTFASQNDLALAYVDNGERERGIALLEWTLAVRQAKFGPDHPDTLVSLNALAAAYHEQGEYARAESLFQNIVSRRESKRRAGHAIVASAMEMLGRNLLKQHRWHEAESLFRDCLTSRVKRPDDWTTFHIRSALGGSLLGQKKYAEAERLIVYGYEGMRSRETKIRPHEKPLLIEAGVRVIQLYEAWDKTGKAAEWRRRIGPPAESRRPGLPARELPAYPFAR